MQGFGSAHAESVSNDALQEDYPSWSVPGHPRFFGLYQI